MYERFYDLVVRIKDCSYEDAGVKLQDCLCDWLSVRALVWWWCESSKGRWLLNQGGYGLVANNQGMVSSWR